MLYLKVWANAVLIKFPLLSYKIYSTNKISVFCNSHSWYKKFKTFNREIQIIRY